MEKKEKKGIDWEIVGSFFGTLCIIAVIGALIYVLFSSAHKQDLARKAELANIQTREVRSCILTSESSSYLSGCFVLGSGGVRGGSYSEMCYYFYMEGQKGFGLECVQANKVEIIPIMEGTPYIEGHFDEHGDLYSGYDTDDYHYELNHYYLYLPAEYIVEEYDVDINTVKEK